jgi:acyl-CoA reductase-like NAD-dependent aldehyde dehydrogenase
MDLSSTVAELRRTFESEKTLDLEWRRAQLRAFQRMITEGRGELCAAMRADLNKSEFEGYMTEINMAEMECAHALAHLDEWCAPENKSTNLFNVPSMSSEVRPQPFGVVLIMGAWNYNVVLSLCPLVPALAGGNCVLLKPGSYSKHSSDAMARLVAKYLDPNAVRVVCGDRDVNAACLAQRFDLIFVTGSTLIGKLVLEAAAKYLTPVVLELGGKSPCIVDRSCDVGVTANRIVHGAMLNAGQTCVRPDYVLVHAAVADEVIGAIRQRLVQFYGQDASQSDFYGRMINDKAAARVAQLVAAEKKRIVFGGEVDLAAKYVQPTMFDFGEDLGAFGDSAIMQEEVFGPLIPIVRYRSLQDVIRFIRQREKPLALYVFTSDSAMREEVLLRTFSGGAVVNDACVHLSNPDLPFGGVGNSGMGSYHGLYGFRCFTHQRAVLIRHPWIGDMPVRYPPYAPWKQTALGWLQMPVWSLWWGKVVRALDVKSALIVVLLALLLAREGGAAAAVAARR